MSSASTRSLYRAKEYATELFGVQPTGLAAKKNVDRGRLRIFLFLTFPFIGQGSRAEVFNCVVAVPLNLGTSGL